jgi:hypothetical protein
MSAGWHAVDDRVAAALDAAPSRIPVLIGSDVSGRSTLVARLAGRMGAEHCQALDLERLVSTPERFITALLATCPFAYAPPGTTQPGPEAAFGEALRVFTHARQRAGGPATFLLDEWLELRTFEHFPGLRQVIPATIETLVASENRFVLTTRFSARTLRLLADAPDRFVMITMPDLSVSDVAADLMRQPGIRSDTAGEFAQIIVALTGGRAGYVRLLVEAMRATPSLNDPVSSLLACLVPGGVLDRTCRYTYEFRLHRARGYGALKAVLAVLASEEPLTLTDIAVRLGRTPGSTRDYLWWLEDVDLIVAHRKQYTFVDPLLRAWVGLFERPTPPDDDTVAAAVQRFALTRLSLPAPDERAV